MIKKEYIKKWEEEFDSFTSSYFNNKDVMLASVLNNKIEAIYQILCIIEKIKQLNEATVKRSELIDFLIWYDKPKIKNNEENAMEVIAEYEKSINSNGA